MEKGRIKVRNMKEKVRIRRGIADRSEEQRGGGGRYRG